jgi:hypothetical protein
MAKLPLLEGGLAATIARAATPFALDATFEPSISQTVAQTPAAPEPWNPVVVGSAAPPVPVRVRYACKAFPDQTSSQFHREGLVLTGMVVVLILSNTMRVWPDGEFVFPVTPPGPGDVITIRLQRYVVEQARTDPAGATWTCLCRR